MVAGCYSSKFIRSSARRFLLEMLGGNYKLRLELLVDICIADFDFNGNDLKLRCAKSCMLRKRSYSKSAYKIHWYN